MKKSFKVTTLILELLFLKDVIFSSNAWKRKKPVILEMEIDLSDIPAGIYFCVLKTNEGVQTKKLIKLD